MSTHVFRYRVDVPVAPGAPLTLDPHDSHHLARVVRRHAGDAIEIIDSAGAMWPARVVSPGPPARVEVLGPAAPPPVAAPVRVYLGLLDWARLDATHAQLTELGVPELVLFSSERAARTPGRKEWQRRRARLDRVADAAARQSGAATRPAVRGVVPFGGVLEEIAPGGGYLLHPAARQSLGAALAIHEGPTATLVVGPEAGFSADELSRAERRGATVCGLGRRVLRTGTAAVVAVSAAMAALGALEPEAPA
jgi:16S rRNA (uracil1498-N3)-methyltransferase